MRVKLREPQRHAPRMSRCGGGHVCARVCLWQRDACQENGHTCGKGIEYLCKVLVHGPITYCTVYRTKQRQQAGWNALFKNADTKQGREFLSEALFLCRDSTPKTEDEVLGLAYWLQDAWDYLAMGDCELLRLIVVG